MAARTLVSLLVLFGGCLRLAAAAAGGACPDDAEVDLCDKDEVSGAMRHHASPAYSWAFLLAIAFQGAGSKHPALTMLLIPFASTMPGATAAVSCGDLKAHYKKENCCGSPTKIPATVPGCPYNFNKPACKDAEPQAPRDLSTNAANTGHVAGSLIAKAAVLNVAQAAKLPLTNVHYHLGAEHKSDEYKDDTASKAYDASHARRLAASGTVRPGYMCAAASTAETAAYTFTHCTGEVAVGKTYEVHYVHSSAGYHKVTGATTAANAERMSDGLGGAANGRGMLNPMVVVQAQIFQIVNDANAPADDDMLHGWSHITHDANTVMYSGSTTGPSHNNAVCSPYAITWHVDKKCRKISAASFDGLCQQMKEKYNLVGDLHPHGSRIIVDSKWVVKSDEVYTLA